MKTESKKPKMLFIQKHPSFDVAGYSIRVHGEVAAPTFHANDVRYILALPPGDSGWLSGDEVVAMCSDVSSLPARLLAAHLGKFLTDNQQSPPTP
jgi:hypothetical protein